jgi:hypothetical protein
LFWGGVPRIGCLWDAGQQVAPGSGLTDGPHVGKRILRALVVGLPFKVLLVCLQEDM